jgi:hypothetical protein
MENQHWSPPNKGKETGLHHLPLSSAQFPGMGTEAAHACVITPTNGTTHGTTIKSMSQNPSDGPHNHRSNVALGKDRYGPAGVVTVSRAYADPTGSGKSMHKVSSAFGSQDNFRSGMGDGS